MRPLWIFLFLSAVIVPTALARPVANPLRRSRQCIIVVAPNWNSTTGVLVAFERSSPSDVWKSRGPQIPVVLGKKGLGWGLGINDAAPGARPRKVEGDNKAPAGVFRLGTAFGYTPARSATWVKLPYLPLTKNIEGVDDPRSRHYNRLVDRSQVARVDWRSSEQMRREDNLYKWGAVIDHNHASVPGAGSLIFFHIWKNASSPTAGCTAMREADLLRLLRWLDPAARPMVVQMPQRDYKHAQPRLNLPALR